jgi:hypothetical protein
MIIHIAVTGMDTFDMKIFIVEEKIHTPRECETDYRLLSTAQVKSACSLT